MYLHRMPEFIDRFVRGGRVERFHRALSCAWRLFWWSRPQGRAFEMTMCTLKARRLGAKVRLDLERCTLECGDGRTFDLRDDDAVKHGSGGPLHEALRRLLHQQQHAGGGGGAGAAPARAQPG